MYYYHDDVDPDTGLAKLPENQFWRVEPRSGQSAGGKSMFDLYIIQRDVSTKTGRNWYGKSVTKTKTRESVVHSGYVWEGPNGSGFAQYISPERLKYSSFYERDCYYTELDKLKTAEQYSAESLTYLGDYPPKSINREETN